MSSFLLLYYHVIIFIMEYKKLILSSHITLHYVYQSHFTVHDFGAIHRYPYIREEMTTLAMMKRMLGNVNAVYPTLAALSSFTAEQYELETGVSQSLQSSRLITSLYASSIIGSLVNDPSMDTSMIYHVLDSLYQPWFNHPDFLINDTVFDDEKKYNLYRFKQIKVSVGEKIFRALKPLFPMDSPYIQELRGQESALKALKKEDLIPQYKKWIQYPVEFYYIGALSASTVVDILNAYPFIISPTKEVAMKHTPIMHGPFKSRTVQGTESQSHYRKIFTTEGKRLEKDAYALQLFNHILGVGSESLLFQELREKNQFCYEVSSQFDTNDTTITVSLGLDKKNIEKTVQIIDKHIAMIQAGELSPTLFNVHKQQVIDGLKRGRDHVDFKLTVVSTTMTMHVPYEEDRIENFYHQLTIEDIQKAACMVQPHRELIYLGVE